MFSGNEFQPELGRFRNWADPGSGLIPGFVRFLVWTEPGTVEPGKVEPDQAGPGLGRAGQTTLFVRVPSSWRAEHSGPVLSVRTRTMRGWNNRSPTV